MTQTESTTNPLARVEAAHRMLAEARSVDEVKDVRDKAKAAALYAKERGYSLDILNYAAEIKVRAERKAGELLVEVERTTGGRPENSLRAVESSTPRQQILREAGINTRQEYEWQQLAKIPEEDFEERLTLTKAAGVELTTSRMVQGWAPPQIQWTAEERELRTRLEAGEAIVINLHAHKTLEKWARETGRFVRIDRQSAWGNPFVMGGDGDRDEVIRNYRDHYLPYKYSLLGQIGQLEGKALGCWCAPLPCHGDVLLEQLEGLLKSKLQHVWRTMICEDFVMLGKTVPEPNSDGRIFVCSAGVSPELRTLLRIYPLARRHSPPRWSINRVNLERNPKDSRQESWKIAGDRSPRAHDTINQSFACAGTLHERDRSQLLARYTVPSIGLANERRISLAVINPVGVPRLRFEHNPDSPESPQLALFDYGDSPMAAGSKRFAYIPRIDFLDDNGPHSLMLRDWGCFEFMRKHGDERRFELDSALHLDGDCSLLVGNLNQHRNAWLVISVLRGVRPKSAGEQLSIFSEDMALVV